MTKLVWFTGAGFLFIWLDLSLGHVSAGLKHPAMWLPLIVLPCAVWASVLAATHATAVSWRLFRIFCLGAIAIGIVGFAFHLARLARDVKGTIQWEVLMRLMRYPPVFAPLSVSGLGMLGLLVSNMEQQRRVP